MKQLKQLFTATALLIMIILLYQQVLKLQSMDASFSLAYLLLALAAVSILFVLDAYGWILVLRTLGVSINPFTAIRIWMVSSIARYLPGGIWSYASRAEMCRQEGIRLSISGLSLLLETLLLASASLACGIPALLMAADFGVNAAQVTGTLLLCALSLHPKCLSLLRFLPGRIGRAFAEIEMPAYLAILKLFLYYLLFWCLFGVAFAIFCQMLIPLEGRSLLAVGSSLALAFFVGFVVIFIPGGIGLRESVIYVLLIPYMSTTEALFIALASRIWIMTGELVSLVGIEALYRLRKPA